MDVKDLNRFYSQERGYSVQTSYREVEWPDPFFTMCINLVLVFLDHFKEFKATFYVTVGFINSNALKTCDWYKILWHSMQSCYSWIPIHVHTVFSHLKSWFLQNTYDLTKLRVAYCVYKSSGSWLQIFQTPDTHYLVFSSSWFLLCLFKIYFEEWLC